MNRNSHNARGSFVNPTSRGWIVSFALVFALVIGSSGQIPTVRAAPAGGSVYFSMKVQSPKTTLRCLETVTYLVIVEAVPSNGLPTPSPASFGIPSGISVVGVNVEADSTNKSVGDFVGAGTVRTAVVFDSELTSGLAAKFKFKAGKPGRTTLYFDGLVGTEHAAVQLDVKVLPCKFKVKATQQAIVAGGGNFNIVAMTDEVEITGDEQGHFAGTTPVNWVGAASKVGICSVLINVASTTQADLIGDMDESGQLTGNISIEAPETAVTGTCEGVSNTSQMSLIADPLRFSVPPSGGVVRVAQGFVFETANMPGSAVIVIVPVEDEAAALLPANPEANWDGVLSLFDALFVLQ